MSYSLHARAVLLVAIAAIFFICQAEAVKCYKCRGEKDERCSDPFNYTRAEVEQLASNKSINSTVEIVDCADGCVKLKDGSSLTYYVIRDEWTELRDCYVAALDPYGAARGEGCRYNYKTEFLGGNTKGVAGCVCTSDFCNGASSFSGLYVVVLLSVALAMMI